jgi:hypothetical protein
MSDLRARFIAITADPRIIPGVHHHCDEWCQYCRVSDRCLGFRCTAEYRKAHSRAEGEETFSSIDEAVAFTRELSAVEGVSTAPLDALLANGSAPPEVSADPLATSAWEYAMSVALAYGPEALMVANRPPCPIEPSPEEIVLWYHLRIYLRVFRALAAVQGKGTESGHSDEALGSAKLVLDAIKQSKHALGSLARSLGQANVEALRARLDALDCGVRERFPMADSFIRLGLDVPVV